MSAMRFTVPFLACAGLLLFGCGSKEDQAIQTPPPKPSAPTAPKEEKVKIEDVVVGKGRPAATGDTIWVQYRGTLRDGREFDSNQLPDKDLFSVTLGQGGVIKGWEQGIPG